jgi:hypothetical protein
VCVFQKKEHQGGKKNSPVQQQQQHTTEQKTTPLPRSEYKRGKPKITRGDQKNREKIQRDFHKF